MQWMHIRTRIQVSILNPKDFPPHYVRHTSGARKKRFLIYLNNHLNDMGKEIDFYVLIAFA